MDNIMPWDTIQVALQSVNYIVNCSYSAELALLTANTTATTGFDAFSDSFASSARKSISSIPFALGRKVFEQVLDIPIISWRQWRQINTIRVVEDWKRVKEVREAKDKEVVKSKRFLRSCFILLKNKETKR
jgi:hypothetical protein